MNSDNENENTPYKRKHSQCIHITLIISWYNI